MLGASQSRRILAALGRRMPPVVAALAAVAFPLGADAVPWTERLHGVESQATLRVMLHPATAPRGSLTDAAQQRLEALAGTALVLRATTRTGALDFTAVGTEDVAAIATRLRNDRGILWAEVAPPRMLAKSKRLAAAESAPAHKLLVRLHEGTDAVDAAARLAALAGTAVAIERTIGAVHVMALAEPRTAGALESLAHAFEGEAGVRYADPVRRVIAHAGPTPNDPYYTQQWALAGIRASDAWALGTGSTGMTVAVVDTGILQHPDLAGRLLPGYDFIADPERARDGDGRERDARDEGDWHGDGECGGQPAQTSFFHGLFVAGLIAANANNDAGIAGVDWSAKILPVRTLGRCGGTFEDVLAGVLWAAGVPVDGAPANPYPAKVINLSLGGPGACAAAIQEAIDDVLAQGTIIVASAGNESEDAANFSPGNCSGVINVAALARSGERASYSNFGARVDLAAPGGDVGPEDGIVSTHDSGTTVPAEPAYDFAMGTSFSAPLVSGTVSLMLARNPNLTAGRVLSILQGTSAQFSGSSTCSQGFCGAGALDTGTAITSTIPAAVDLPPGAVAIVEFYDPTLDHYFVTSDADEIAALDAASGRWLRTGHVFYGWGHPSLATAGAFPRNVCRFYAGPEVQIDSYYFTADPQRCAFVSVNNQGLWTLQTNEAFWIEVPDASGACRSGTVPVYAFFNNRRDANHRYTIDLSVKRAMQNRTWVPDGATANGAVYCSLI